MTPKQAPGMSSIVRETEQFLAEQVRKAEEFLRATRRYLDELRRIEGPHQSGPAGMPRINPKAPAIDAILLYLDQAGKPQAKEAIVDKMVEWGVNANTSDQPRQIRKSITYHLLSEKEKSKRWKHVKAMPAKLKWFGSLIGKAEWKGGEEGGRQNA